MLQNFLFAGGTVPEFRREATSGVIPAEDDSWTALLYHVFDQVK